MHLPAQQAHSSTQSAESSAILTQRNSSACQTPPVSDVGSADAELERHIRECGREVEEAMARRAESGNFADRGDADFWRLAMERAIRERRPDTAERGA